MAAAKRFHAFPLYWVGDRFENWKIVGVLGLEGRGEIVSFIYGDGGDEASCAPPVQIQVSPLCNSVWSFVGSTRWRPPRIRGAPVIVVDAAPVLLTARAQVKVYIGQGANARTPLRVFQQLRSLNRVGPVIARTDPFPAPPADVLAGRRRCRD